MRQIVPNCDRSGMRRSDGVFRLSAGLMSRNMAIVGAARPSLGYQHGDPIQMLLFRSLFVFALVLLATPSFAARCGGDFNSFVANMSSEAQAAGVAGSGTSAALRRLPEDRNRP